MRAISHLDRGNALMKLRRLDEALASYDQAIKLRPGYANAYSNRGVTLHELKRLDEALASYDQAIRLRPDSAEAYNNRGLTLQELKQPHLALASYDQAIKLKPGYANAHSNRGLTLQKLDRLEEALASYHEAIKLRPDHGFLYGTWLHAKMKLCDWSALEIHIAELLAKIESGLQATPPFAVLAITGSLALQRKAAEIAVSERNPAIPESPSIPKCVRRKKLRIGYFSADYHDHPTAYLMAGLFERHDRDRFELLAFSFGPERDDRMRRRVSAAFDQFIDVRDKSDKDIALLSRNLAVDIAVDLKGFTQGHRAGIFSCRAAPIQVNYLGYPGTMGATYIDYLIADRTVVPEDCKQYYAEKIVYLPDSYQVNDRQRRIADKVFSREELGLPEQGFVFCCFNNCFKIAPATFDGWMRMLKQVDGSVLWLFEDNPTASGHLRKEAEARGVSAERLVFARRMPLPDHLARHRAADLFVDTLPCNAHTTASDALWAGLPIVTCVGEAFASRVAASLLNAVDLPELITTTQEQYEALAIRLATDPRRLGQIKQKLESNRLTTPLFDTQLFTRHIEAAYTQMHEQYEAGLAPQHIHVVSEPMRRTQHG
jgi:predicted O-linked N-acetylglucosamine transferase (SPINDLY family)